MFGNSISTLAREEAKLVGVHSIVGICCCIGPSGVCPAAASWEIRIDELHVDRQHLSHLEDHAERWQVGREPVGSTGRGTIAGDAHLLRSSVLSSIDASTSRDDTFKKKSGQSLRKRHYERNPAQL